MARKSSDGGVAPAQQAQANGKPKIDYAAFIRAWNGSASLLEVEAKLTRAGITLATEKIPQVARYLKTQGVQMKPYPRKKREGTIDWASLQAIGAETLNG